MTEPNWPDFMRYRLSTFLFVAALIPPVLGGLWSMPAIGLATNCGGNNAARSFVRQHVIVMTMFAEENPNHVFSLSTATDQQLKTLASLSKGWGVEDNDILISTKPLSLDDSTNPTIVVACRRPFTNVPQYLFHRAPPTHAVAYSNGATALITPKQFAALDHTAFLSTSQIATSK